MQNSLMLFTFFVFDWKCCSWPNLVQKIKIVNLSWNLVSELIKICTLWKRGASLSWGLVLVLIGILGLALAVGSWAWYGGWDCQLWDWLWISCGMAHYGRILSSLFQDVLLVLGKCSFWWGWGGGRGVGGCGLGYHSMKFRYFLEISKFPKILL